MKKLIILILTFWLTSGCGAKNLNCTMSDNSLNYKNKREIKVTFKDDKLNYLESTITEEYDNSNDANDAYLKYQELYTTYNKAGVKAEYKKNKNSITGIYTVDEVDLSKKVLKFEFDISLNKVQFQKSLEKSGYKCK